LLVTVAVLVGLHPFFGKCPSVYEKAHEVRREMLFGPVLLAVTGLLLGLFPNLLSALVFSPAITAVKATYTEVRLKLWHGFNPILLMSILTVLSGVGIYFLRRHVRRLAGQLAPAAKHTPSAWYYNTLSGLRRVAAIHTRIMQHGYLAGYVWVVLGCAGMALYFAVFPVALRGTGNPGFLDWTLLVIFIANSMLLLLTGSRMAAVVGMSAIGLAIALFYGIYSGLDLAMVQFSVETLGVVLLLLVLLKLPGRYRHEERVSRRLLTGAAAIFAGVAIAAVMYVSVAHERGSMGEFYAQNSVPLGHGRNIVNVILVDFRALDTLGEVAVVGIAALGVVAMLHKERAS
jgi:multicomponent Na+:H+ antiporter subunit A